MYSKEYLLNNRIVFNCKTEASAKSLILIYYECGFEWIDLSSTLLDTKWHKHKEKTCYSITKDGYICNGSLNTIITIDVKIINFNIYRTKHIIKEYLNDKKIVIK